jgi:hypothetical protein
VKREARAGDLGAALEVDHAEGRTKVPVRLRREREHRRRADTPHLGVVGRAPADRHGRVRHVRDRLQAAVAALLDGLELRFDLLDVLRALPVRFLDLRRVEALALGARHLVARGVLLALETFQVGDEAPPARFERRQFLQLGGQIHPAPLQRAANAFEVVSEKRGIEHAICGSYITAPIPSG